MNSAPKNNVEKSVESQKGYARVLPCNQLTMSSPFHWISLALSDYKRTPFLSISYGFLFVLIAALIFAAVYLHGSHLVILPSLIIFVLCGPFLATGLYDISWELEKKHQPTFSHAIHAMGRNSVSCWGFAVLLTVIMIFWTRVAALLHALYPVTQGASLEEFLPFLTLGSILGGVFALLVFSISAFSLPLMIERKVDLMTAIFSSVNAVYRNAPVMIVWGLLILLSVVIGFVTFGIGLLFTMPLMAYATWHGYLATIHTKYHRGYE